MNNWHPAATNGLIGATSTDLLLDFKLSDTPAEPALLEAAAQVMDSTNAAGQDSHTIYRLLSNGLIGKDERDDLVVRLLRLLLNLGP